MSVKARLWPRSLIARMTVLSAVFLVLAVVWFALVPYWFYINRDPLVSTETRVRAEIQQVLVYPERELHSLLESATLAEVAAANEKFRYHVRKGSEEVSFGPPPRHLAVIPRLRAMLEDTPKQTNYVHWSAQLQDDGSTAWVGFGVQDGVEDFYEVAGIDTPVESTTGIFAVNPMVFWMTSRDPLIAGVGVLTIAFVVLVLAARSLRTLARAADTIDATAGKRQLLPEQGLPTEVSTLVRAINDMIRRVETAHEEQEMFLATAAHELRTPMAVLRTRLEELPESATKEELRDDVRRIASLVDQLLRLMQIRNNDDLPDEVDLVATARDVVAERAPLTVDRGVDIELESQTKALLVKGHRGLVGVAIANLVDNALSFSQPGDTLKVSVDASGGVSVRDQGPGVPVAELERIFEPFAKNPPNRQGHGLGLAIVRAVMSAHGGSVAARNIEGGGTTFALQFTNPLPRAA